MPGCTCSTPSSKPWSYTAGLTSIGQPELVVLGPSLDAAHHLVHAVVEARREGRFDTGTGDLATCSATIPSATRASKAAVRVAFDAERWALAGHQRNQARVMENAGMTRGAADSMYWPNCGMSAAWAWSFAAASAGASSTTSAVKVSVRNSTVMRGLAFRL